MVKRVGLHAHGCTQCSLRYQDACQSPHQDGCCRNCSGSAGGRPLWERNSDPMVCCHERVRPVRKDELKTYRLAGERPWWICTTCSRTHPYNPSAGGAT